MGLLTKKHPTDAKRIKGCENGVEYHLTEPAVMLTVAQWLFAQGAHHVSIRPDGMHLKQFDVRAWLETKGFVKTENRGKTSQGGLYRLNDLSIEVIPKSGLGDVTAEVDGKSIEVETKGGCINSTHAGQVSKLRKGLAEAVGQAIGSPRQPDRLMAIVPEHDETRKVADRMIDRCLRAGVEIALASEDGSIAFVGPMISSYQD